MKICKECGTPCTDDTVFCFVCGTKFQDTAISSENKSDGSQSPQKHEKEEVPDERQRNFEKWYDKAIEYFDDEQYDLAKAAIEKASLYYNQFDDNAQYLSYAADIYRLNNDYETALKYVNEACIIEPNNWVHIAVKGAIHNSLKDYQKAYDCFLKANAIAQSTRNTTQESQSQGFLANVLCYGLHNYDAAETAALKAIELGDFSGSGARVLKELNRPLQPSTAVPEMEETPCESNGQPIEGVFDEEEYYIDVYCPCCHAELSYTNTQILEGDLSCPDCGNTFKYCEEIKR